MLLCDKAMPAGWRHTRGSQRARSPQRRARLLFAVRPQGGAVRLGPRRRAPPLPARTAETFRRRPQPGTASRFLMQTFSLTAHIGPSGHGKSRRGARPARVSRYLSVLALLCPQGRLQFNAIRGRQSRLHSRAGRRRGFRFSRSFSDAARNGASPHGSGRSSRGPPAAVTGAAAFGQAAASLPSAAERATAASAPGTALGGGAAPSARLPAAALRCSAP